MLTAVTPPILSWAPTFLEAFSLQNVGTFQMVEVAVVVHTVDTHGPPDVSSLEASQNWRLLAAQARA